MLINFTLFVWSFELTKIYVMVIIIIIIIVIIIIIRLIIYRGFLHLPSRGSHVTSDNTHTIIQHTPICKYT